jgi:hypothetical protein
MAFLGVTDRFSYFDKSNSVKLFGRQMTIEQFFSTFKRKKLYVT